MNIAIIPIARTLKTIAPSTNKSKLTRGSSLDSQAKACKAI